MAVLKVAVYFLVLIVISLAVEEKSSDSPPKVIETDVVVVGAGYAGLTVARKLSRMNFNVHVLEASNATGGRTKNFCLKSMKPDVESDFVVELGGQWLANKTVQPHSWKLIVEELGYKLFDSSYAPNNKNLGIVYTSAGRFNFTTLMDAFHKLPQNVQAELVNAWTQLDEMASKIDLVSPFSSREARKWDSQTFTSWINNTVHLEESRNALQVMCTSIIAQSADVVSFLHMLFYIRASKGMFNLIASEQQYRVIGGTQAPTFKMARDLGSDHVLLSTPVHKITQTGDNGCTIGSVTVEAAENNVIVKARYAVVTGAPPTSGIGIRFVPPLPFEKYQLFQRMPMGNSIKGTMVYPTPFWRDQGFTGTLFASVPFFGEPNNILFSNCFDNTPFAGTPGVLFCFLEGETSLEIMRLSHEDRKKVLGKWFAKSFGPQANDAMILLDYNWSAQPFIGGAYSSYFPPGVWTQQGHELRKSFGNVHWAGAEYATDGFGYINGAIQSGNYTANQIANQYQECIGMKV